MNRLAFKFVLLINVALYSCAEVNNKNLKSSASTCEPKKIIEGVAKYNIYEKNVFSREVIITGKVTNGMSSVEYDNGKINKTYHLNTCGELESKSPQILKTMVNGAYHRNTHAINEASGQETLEAPSIFWNVKACESQSITVRETEYTSESCKIESSDNKHKYNIIRINLKDESNPKIPVSGVIKYESQQEEGDIKIERIL